MASQTTALERTHTGRPRISIDWELVGQLLEKQYTATSIAAHLGIAEDTLRKRCPVDLGWSFSEFSHKRKMQGLECLRAKQFEVAMSGNVSMLIWLGKQYLGQSDRTEIKRPVDTADAVAERLVQALGTADVLITDDLDLDSVIDAFAYQSKVSPSALRPSLSRLAHRLPEKARRMISGLNED